MSLNQKMERAVDVALRIPPLFLIDVILNQTLLEWLLVHLLPGDLQWYTVVCAVFLIIFLLFGAAILFFMGRPQLVNTYSFVLSLVVLVISYTWNKTYIFRELHRDYDDERISHVLFGNFGLLVRNFILQLGVSYIWNTLRPENIYIPANLNYIQDIFITLPLLSPIIARILVFPKTVVEWTPFMSLVWPLTEMTISLLRQLPNIYLLFKSAYSVSCHMIKNYGLQVFLETHWTRLQVPTVLRAFWITIILQEILTRFLIGIKVVNLENLLTMDAMQELAKNTVIRGCATVVAVLGMTSCVSYITHYIGLGMAVIINSDNEEDRSMGTVSAVLFFILALQTGLTSLSPEKKLQRLYRNFCLLTTAILHFIHSMVNPLLMSLAASRNRNVQRHARALGMCVFLMVAPVCLLYYLWSIHTVSTWLLAVTAFSIEVVIKVIISLLVYTLFMIDAYRETFWEKLDDYVYYIKSTGNTIEFLFGIFLFCNGFWIMMFESGGTIRACMMCIHAYFNIWVQAKNGWQVFMRRRTAVKKINSLPEATEEQLRQFNDVCAICYQDLGSARVTKCKHFFHGVCLRKWLYVQDKCPLCHEVMYNSEALDQNAQEQTEEPAANAQGVRLRHEHQE